MKSNAWTLFSGYQIASLRLICIETPIETHEVRKLVFDIGKEVGLARV